MMAAPVKIGVRFDASTPIALFQSMPRQPVFSDDLFVDEVSRGGQRFLINTRVRTQNLLGLPKLT
jgi:hypothetical protein